MKYEAVFMKKILKKVLDELAKDEPNLSYIRGLLEAVSEDEVIPYKTIDIPQSTTLSPSTFQPPVVNSVMDDASFLEARAKSHIQKHGLPKEVQE